MGNKKTKQLPELYSGEPAFLPEFITHAQNFEDVMLRRALRDVENGYYVDVGAFHPTHHSISCWFHQNGWTGINVEPNEKFFLLLEVERRRDVNLRFAITGKPGVTTLYLYDALSTVQDEIAAVHRQNGLDMSQTVQVEAITLDQLFEGYVRSRTVDFLKLDVEGSEGEILNSTSFERTRPRILVVEATKPDTREPTWHTWERGLLKKGYLLVWFDGLNRFYLREEDRWRRKFFKAAPSVFDNVRFAPNDSRIKFIEGQSVEALCSALDTAQQQISTLDIEREQIDDKASTLERELEFARADVSRRVSEADRMVSVTGHLERALSAALDKLWNSSGEINTLGQQKVEAEGEVRAARSEIARISAERDALATHKVRVEDELQAARSENSRLSAERDASASDNIRAKGELQAAWSENIRLVAERDALAADKIRTEGELQAARSENSRLVAERDQLTVEIVRHQIKLRARAGLAAERDALAADKIRIESELEDVRSENSRLSAERDASASDNIRAKGELQAAWSENIRLVAERDALAADKTRIESEFEAVRGENSRLLAEHRLEKSRLEGELEAARRDDSRLVGERGRLTVEIARYQIKQRAHADLVAEHERLAIENARWFEAAVAAAYARRSQPGESTRRPWKLMITASTWRLKCSMSRSGWEGGPRMSLALADHALNERQWQLAARCYGDVLEQWPKNAAVWVQFGHALKESGRVAEAEAVYRHAIQLSPAIADTHLQLGHALKLQGRTNEAIEAYAAALRLDPALDYAADELMALGWTSSDIEKAKSYDPSTDNRSQSSARRVNFAKLALQRMFQ